MLLIFLLVKHLNTIHLYIYMTIDSSQFPIITFNSLYNVLREEEKINELNSLPDFFFEGVEEFLKIKLEESKKNSQDSKLKNKLHTAEKIYSKLKKVRAKKIASFSIYSLDIDDSFLQKKEKDFKEEIQKLFKKTYL